MTMCIMTSVQWKWNNQSWLINSTLELCKMDLSDMRKLSYMDALSVGKHEGFASKDRTRNYIKTDSLLNSIRRKDSGQNLLEYTTRSLPTVLEELDKYTDSYCDKCVANYLTLYTEFEKRGWL